MNKELTPLEALHSLVEMFATKKYDEKGNLIYWENILDTLSKNSEYAVIEKSLKALEIIKKKKVDVWFILISNSVEDYNLNSGYKYPLTQEQYDLLKEVLL